MKSNEIQWTKVTVALLEYEIRYLFTETTVADIVDEFIILKWRRLKIHVLWLINRVCYVKLTFLRDLAYAHSI